MSAYFNPDYATGSFQLENNTKINFFANIIVPIDRLFIEYRSDVKVLGVDSRQSESQKYSNFLQKSLEICTFPNNPMLSDPIAYLFYRMVISDKNSKLFEKCPIPKVRFRELYLKGQANYTYFIVYIFLG